MTLGIGNDAAVLVVGVLVVLCDVECEAVEAELVVVERLAGRVVQVAHLADELALSALVVVETAEVDVDGRDHAGAERGQGEELAEVDHFDWLVGGSGV